MRQPRICGGEVFHELETAHELRCGCLAAIVSGGVGDRYVADPAAGYAPIG